MVFGESYIITAAMSDIQYISIVRRVLGDATRADQRRLLAGLAATSESARTSLGSYFRRLALETEPAMSQCG